MPAGSEKAMFHAGSRFGRRWANEGARVRPREPEALACGPWSPSPPFYSLATCTTADGRQLGDQAWSYARQFIVLPEATRAAVAANIFAFVIMAITGETRLRLCTNRFEVHELTTSPARKMETRACPRAHARSIGKGGEVLSENARATLMGLCSASSHCDPGCHRSRGVRGARERVCVRVMRRPEPGKVNEGEGTGRSGPSWSPPLLAPPPTVGRTMSDGMRLPRVE
jgi:hypothetical protein